MYAAAVTRRVKLSPSAGVSRVNTRRATGKYVRGGGGGGCGNGRCRGCLRVARLAAATSRGTPLSPRLHDARRARLSFCHANFAADKTVSRDFSRGPRDAAFPSALTVMPIFPRRRRVVRRPARDSHADAPFSRLFAT